MGTENDMIPGKKYTPQKGWRENNKSTSVVPETFEAIIEKLGPPEEIFQISKKIRRKPWGQCFIAGLFSFLIALIALAIFDSGEIEVIWLGFLFVLLILWLMYRGFKQLRYAYSNQVRSVLVFEHGLVLEQKGEILSFPWKEIKALYLRKLVGNTLIREIAKTGKIDSGYYLSLKSFHGFFAHSCIELEREDGICVTITWYMESYPMLTQLIQTKLLENMVAECQNRLLDEGQLDDFAPVGLTLEDLSWNQFSLPWALVGRIEILGNKINIYNLKTKKVEMRIPVQDVANVQLLITIIAWMVNRLDAEKLSKFIDKEEKRLGSYDPVLGWQSLTDLPAWAQSLQDKTFVDAEPQFIYLASFRKRLISFIIGSILTLIGLGLVLLVAFIFADNGQKNGNVAGIAKLFVIGAAVLVVGLSVLVIAILEGRNAVVVYPRGLITRIRSKQIQILFEDIIGLEVVENQIDSFPILGKGEYGEILYGIPFSNVLKIPLPKYYLHFQKGKKIKLASTLEHLDHLGELIQKKLFETLWPQLHDIFRNGIALSFHAQFDVYRDEGIFFKKKYVTWEDLGKLYIRDGNLFICQGRKNKVFAQIPLLELVNVPILITLLSYGANLTTDQSPKLTVVEEEET